VMLRCPPPVALLGAMLATALSLTLQSTPTHAAAVNPNASTTTADYRLINVGNNIPVPDPSSQGPQVVALVTPTGGIVPPTLADGSQGTPLTVLPDSSGFDPSQLVVALKDGTSASGQAQQMFGLSFYGQGLQTGGVLHFALSIDSSLASNPPVLQSQTPGVMIVPDTLPPITPPIVVGSGNGGGNGPHVPEPLSVVLWSAVLVGVVARRHLLRKSRSL
jgi:hypothetical protein